uniref:Sushi domain-containing protein n=1 Tax=Cyclopterus lumpus TaxID=8103 RepID=A0A8C3A2I9_CYCLU
MRLITQSWVLFLWMYLLALVKSQKCTREQFFSGDLFDSNFDTTGLEAIYPNGKQVRVGCNVGYRGFFKLICKEGQWDSRGKPCEPRTCGHPGDAQFADFHLENGDDFVFGSQVVFTCHKGYQMVSRKSYRRCMADGWDGVVPVCEAQQCPVINVDNNVQVIGDPDESTYGNVVRFTCKSSTEILYGSAEMYCDENGEWRGNVPKCKGTAVPIIEHGFVRGKIQEYKEHEILPFGCDARYKSIDVRSSKCTKRGITAEWSPTPACESIVCRLPPPLEGTNYEPTSNNVFIPGDTVRVICGNKHWISNLWDTSAEATCKEIGDWTLRPVCQEVTCSNRRPPHVNYWTVKWGQQIKMDDTVTYSCQWGYKKTDGATNASCTRNGWVPNIFCQEITCNRQDFQNANIVQRNNRNIYKKNERVNYICKNGYEGRFTLTCGEKGWTRNEQCKCQTADEPHGIVAGPYNDTLYYSCKIGYKLSTKGWWVEAKCTDGVWSGFKGCIANTMCGNVPEIPNGRVTPCEKSKDAQITCEDGYHAQVTSLTCHDGKWLSEGVSPETFCKLTAVSCNPPRKVDNALIVDSYQKEYLSDSTVTYQCRDKYIILDHEDTIQCKEGQWEEKNIMCTPYCDKLKDESINFTADKERYMDGDVIEYQCVLYGIEGNATCNNTEWNKSEDCKVKPCELPDDTPNGYYQIIKGEDLVFGTEIKYVCNEGYQMVSKVDTRTCMLDKWTNHVPICDPLTCELPPVDEQIIVKGLPENDDSILPDRFLEFSCVDHGKYLNGSALLICGKDGQWDNPFPSCEDITCEVAVMQPHLSVTGLPPGKEKMNIGHKLRFYCDHQFAIDGSTEIECLQTGEWNAAFPLCTGTVTGFSDSVHLKTYEEGNQLRKGQKLSFYCRYRGDYLRGKAEVECLASGQWSHSYPTCGDPSDCEMPPPIADGDTTHSLLNKYRHGDWVQYSCQNFYIMEGYPYKRCINGEWDGQMTCLKPCTVDRAAMNSHNISFRYKQDNKIYSPHNDHITFVCTRGKTQVGTLEMRQRCVDGVMQLPTCQ